MISSGYVAPCWVFKARLLNWINQLHCQREMCCHGYCQPQTVDFSNKHKKTSLYKQYKLIAHPVSEILFLALESILGDCTAIQTISEVRWNAYWYQGQMHWWWRGHRSALWQLWGSSHNIQTRQNLSILSRKPLMLITSTESLSWSNFFSSWAKKCWDYFRELQKISTLLSGLRWRKSATSNKPFKTNCAFLEHISTFMSVSRWWNSTTVHLRMQ